MVRLAVVIPTIGRDSLHTLLSELEPQIQEGDRVLVMCDRPEAYDKVQRIVEHIRDARPANGVWRCFYSDEPLGQCGHPQRNRAIDNLLELEQPPDFCWSIDDDDLPTFGALDLIRAAAASGAGPWYVFRMEGGQRSHFPGVTVPTQGPVIQPGNIGTPMLVFPSDCDSRFGTSVYRGQPAGYYGDAEMAEGLWGVLGEPVWRDEVVATVRP